MLVTIAAIISVVIFIGMIIFQILLAVGLPLGRFAYRGKYKTLPKNLRVMSLVAVGIFVLGIISVLVRVGILLILPDSIIFAVVVWILAFYSSLSILANLASESKSEKRVMTPISFIIAVCLFIVAIGA